MPRAARLTRDDWAAAALDALVEGGLAAVAVEPVAARLGASKSSFYWLFDNRQALLAAALQRWEHAHTDEMLETLAAIPEPAERLRHLVQHAFAATGPAALALLLLTNSDDPVVHAAARRVTHRRLAAIEATLRELGHPKKRAAHLAAASYAIYLGTAALRRVGAAPKDNSGYVETVLARFAVA